MKWKGAVGRTVCESVDEMEEHTWVPWDPWGGSMDPLGGPMGPWDRWDLGLKDPRYFLRVVLSIPGPARPEDHQSSMAPLCTNTITNPLQNGSHRTQSGWPGRLKISKRKFEKTRSSLAWCQLPAAGLAICFRKKLKNVHVVMLSLIQN